MDWKSLSKVFGAAATNMTRKTCRCGWYRYLATERRNIVFQHPIYGEVTGERMTELDIAQHSCVQYRLALKRRSAHANS
jgi:hypothetical protein